MKGDKKVLQYLNEALKKELTAINQYFLHARMLENWGVTKLAKHEYAESIEEMAHADRYIQRILMLDGLPNLQELGKLYIGENVKEVIECDLKLEYEAIPMMKEAIAYCDTAQDYVSRDLLISILAEEEKHIDGLETQLNLIEIQGLQNYILMQSAPAEGGE